VHKWFARRPETLFRGLALAEFVDRPLAEHYFESHDLDGVILDPFMGGGTSMFEANRMGLSVVGYDTNPMSRWLVERELEALEVDAFEREGESIATEMEEKLRDLYTTRCEECGEDVPVKFFMWVKTHVCECGEETLLFPGPLVAGRKMGRHTHDVVICGSCRTVEQFLPREMPDDCPHCASPYDSTKVPAKGTCACGRPFVVGRPENDGPPKHTLFALEYHCDKCKGRRGRRGRFFKGADAEDHARFARARERFATTDSPFWPEDGIPPGDETNRLLRWGYQRFRDLHNERQLQRPLLLRGPRRRRA
jgi:adenine-specific DNA methylase